MTAADQYLDTIQARLNAATPGPWFEFHENGTPGELEAFHCPPATGAFLVKYADWDQQNKDAEFIANAPADLAKLLNAVKAVQAVLDDWAAMVPFPDAEESQRWYSLGKRHAGERIRAELAEALTGGAV